MVGWERLPLKAIKETFLQNRLVAGVGSGFPANREGVWQSIHSVTKC
jgi:hypothetical protein